MTGSIVSIATRFSAVALLFLVAACAAPPPAPTLEPIAFRDRPPFTLDVERIEIVETPMHVSAGEISERLETTPTEAVRAWADGRLRAGGWSGRTARYTIRRATIVETQLPRTGGITGAFRVDQGQRFDVVMDVRLDIVENDGTRVATVEARAERFATAAEDMSYNGRRALWHRLVRDTAGALDSELLGRVPDFLGAYVR